ncbi:hypothetical protein CsSME_00008605 [Camellia sinensis var. sinensis]
MKKIEEERRRTQKHKKEDKEASWKLTSINGQNLHHEGNEKNVGVELYIAHSHQKVSYHRRRKTNKIKKKKKKTMQCIVGKLFQGKPNINLQTYIT